MHFLFGFSFFTIAAVNSASWRRRQRRKRALVRHHLWLHRTGLVKLTRQKLHTCVDTLATHHSADRQNTLLSNVRVERSPHSEVMETDDSWRCKKCYKIASWSHVHCPFCDGHWTKMADNKYVPQNRRARSQTPRQVHQTEDANWHNQQSSRRRNTSNRSSASSRQDAKPKGRRGRGRGKKKDVDVLNYATPTLPPPWKPSSGPSKDTPTAAEVAACTADKYEMAQALRDAYPDPKNRPENVRRALIKAEQNTSKHLTSALHRNTDVLDKTRSMLRQLQEAQHKHRQAWLRHLKQVMESFEKQMNAFDDQQADYQQRITNGRRTINVSRRELQRLNAQASTASVPETILDDDVDDEALPSFDQEEKELRSQVGEILQKCMKLAEPTEAVEIASDDDMDDVKHVPKRHRSQDPPVGGHGSVSGGK